MTSARASMLVVLATLAVFGQTLTAGFVWDDLSLLQFNERLAEPGALRHALTWDFWEASDRTGSVQGYWRPMVKVSHVLLRAVAPGEAWPFHAFNVVLHALAALLVTWWVSLRLGSTERARAPALAAGLLFALHPSRYEAVGWASCSTELFFACFAVSAAIAFEQRSKWAWLALLGAAFSKETAVVLPVLFAADAWLRGQLRGRRALVVGALGVVALPITLRPLVGLPFPFSASEGGAPALFTRVLGAFAAYHERTVAPLEATILPFEFEQLGHGWFDVPVVVVGLGALLVVAWAALALTALRWPSSRPWLADALWWLVPLAPVLQLIPVPGPALVSDRFLYLPLAGVAALLARGLAAAPDANRRPLWLALGGVLAIFSAQLMVALPAFDSNAAFFSREFALHPGNEYLGESYARALGSGSRHYAAQKVLETLLRAPHPPFVRTRLTAVLAQEFAETVRDSQQRELRQLATFFDGVSALDLVDLQFGDESWSVEGARKTNLLAGPGGEKLENLRLILHARLGEPALLLRKYVAEDQRKPSVTNTLQLATALALDGRWPETEATLVNAAQRMPELAQSEYAQYLLAAARLRPAPPLDALDFAIRRASFFSRSGSPRRARLELKPFLGQADERRLLECRVQVELDDRDFDAAVAILDEALAAHPDDAELRQSREAVVRSRQAFADAVAAELELADPAAP